MMQRIALLGALALLAACASPSQPPPSQPVAPAPAPAPSAQEKEDTKSGVTLQDVADELEWRKKTADELKAVN
ncbi:MAG: hypothetical protein P8X75_12435 [Limibacillus sp.]|jgi:hypothetical protein